MFLSYCRTDVVVFGLDSESGALFTAEETLELVYEITIIIHVNHCLIMHDDSYSAAHCI